MAKLNAYIILLVLFFAISKTACKKPPSKTKSQVMQERLHERLNRWQRALVNRCQKEVLEEASSIVDSILLANARLKRDTSDRPTIPGRPLRPEFIPPEDTLPIEPLIEVEKDTNGQ